MRVLPPGAAVGHLADGGPICANASRSRHTSCACAGSIACARSYLPRYDCVMAAGGTSAASNAAEVGHLGFEALFATQHMQNQVTRLVDDALARAHGTNLTGFELLSRLERLPAEGASVRF